MSARILAYRAGLLSLAFFFVIVLLPLEAAAQSHHWCFLFAVSPVDADVGEDILVDAPGTTKARGIKVKIKKNGVNLFEGFAGKHTGCVDFEHTQGAVAYDVTLYAYTKIEFVEPIKIRAWNNKSQYDTWATNQTPANLLKWQFYSVVPTCSGGDCEAEVTTPSSTGAVSNMLAYATRQIYRTEYHSVDPFNRSSDNEVHLINDKCPPQGSGSAAGSCQSGDLLYIQSPDGQRRKFLVAHEVGHWLHYIWNLDRGLFAGTPGLAGAYDVTEIEDGEHPACNSDEEAGYVHMMRSVEWQGGAFLEGFAHFLAAFAFNDHTESDAYFKYYKSWGFLYNYDTINVETGGALQGGVGDFLHQACGCLSSDSNCSEYGVELDWLRHYWDFLTDTTGMDISLIFKQTEDAYDATSGYSKTDVHDDLEAEWSGSHLSSWDTYADANGADATPE